MNGLICYQDLKALIQVLENQLEKVDREALTPGQLRDLHLQTKEAWNIFCRRKQEARKAA